MSKQNEIIKLFKKYQRMVSGKYSPSYLLKHAVDSDNYGFLASDIEKLFEVEGKVIYVIERWYKVPKKGGYWKDIAKSSDMEHLCEYYQNIKKEFPDNKYHLLKRTTIDEVIE